MRARKFASIAMVSIGIVAIYGLTCFEVHQAVASCRICWDPGPSTTPICTTVDNSATDFFSYDVVTIVNSQNESVPWTLLTWETPGSSVNTENEVVDPHSHTISSNGETTVTTTNEGNLTNDTQDGRFVMTAWQSGSFGCSATFETIIKADGASCP